MVVVVCFVDFWLGLWVVCFCVLGFEFGCFG